MYTYIIIIIYYVDNIGCWFSWHLPTLLELQLRVGFDVSVEAQRPAELQGLTGAAPEAPTKKMIHWNK